MALQDKRVLSLVQYAMKVEKAIFEASTSREEYYQLLAVKIYQIRKELEERRRVKNEMEKIKKMRGGMHTTVLFGWFYQLAIGRSYLSKKTLG